MISCIISFLLGVLIASYFVVRSLKIDIDADLLTKANAICHQYGDELCSITCYYDRDVFYCKQLKIIAKKDEAQKMWIHYEVVKVS